MQTLWLHLFSPCMDPFCCCSVCANQRDVWGHSNNSWFWRQCAQQIDVVITYQLLEPSWNSCTARCHRLLWAISIRPTPGFYFSFGEPVDLADVDPKNKASDNATMQHSTVSILHPVDFGLFWWSCCDHLWPTWCWQDACEQVYQKLQGASACWWRGTFARWNDITTVIDSDRFYWKLPWSKVMSRKKSIGCICLRSWRNSFVVVSQMCYKWLSIHGSFKSFLQSLVKNIDFQVGLNYDFCCVIKYHHQITSTTEVAWSCNESSMLSGRPSAHLGHRPISIHPFHPCSSKVKGSSSWSQSRFRDQATERTCDEFGSRTKGSNSDQDQQVGDVWWDFRWWFCGYGVCVCVLCGRWQVD